MGWTGINLADTTVAGIRRWIEREFTFTNAGGSNVVVDVSNYGSRYYAAVETTTPSSRQTWALVIQTHVCNREHYNFYYKDIDESMGPFDCEAVPIRLLNRLTPTEDKEAVEWRERARAWHARRLPAPSIGSTLRFARKIRFQDGFEGDTFEVVRYGRGKAFRSAANGRLYRITNVRHLKFEKVSQKD